MSSKTFAKTKPGPKPEETVSDKEIQLPGDFYIAAIDIGTSFSGYAFSKSGDYEQDPKKVELPRWNPGRQGPVSMKTPSVLLISKITRKLVAFGYEAETKFASATEDQKMEWMYFHHFKMAFHRNMVKNSRTEEILVEDITGIKMKAMEIFSMSIKFLRDHAFETYLGHVDKDKIVFTVTFPAIWEKIHQDFMKKAAIKAGIKSTHLLLLSEPEAACKYHEVDQCVARNSAEQQSFLVLDIGGGTTDIATYESQSSNAKEILTGVCWGGTKVDDAFLQFLIKIFGMPTLTEFKEKFLRHFMDLFREFEGIKRAFTGKSTDPIMIRLPDTLVTMFQKSSMEHLPSALQQAPFAKEVSYEDSELKINSKIFKSFFTETSDGIVKEIMHVMQNKQFRKMIVAGGFAESAIIRDELKENFKNMSVILCTTPEMAVLKGAVIYGHSIMKRRQYMPFADTFKSTFHTISSAGPEQARFIIERPDGIVLKVFDPNVDVCTFFQNSIF